MFQMIDRLDFNLIIVYSKLQPYKLIDHMLSTHGPTVSRVSVQSVRGWVTIYDIPSSLMFGYLYTFHSDDDDG